MTAIANLSLTVLVCCLCRIETFCICDDTDIVTVRDMTKFKSVTESNFINLDLSNSNLTDVQYIISKLRESGVGNRIINMDLSNNNLQNLLPELLELIPNVKIVIFSNNNLTSLHPDTFIPCQCIEILDLSYNNLGYIPSGLLGSKYMGLSMLTFLDVSHNRMKDMGLDLFHEGLSQLKQVNVSYNEIEYFEPWPYSTGIMGFVFRTGYVFNFSHNNIRDFSNKMKYYVAHEQPFAVDLKFNNFTRLSLDMFKRFFAPNSNFSEYNLVQLGIDVQYNPWICDCEMHSFVMTFKDSFLSSYSGIGESVHCASPPALAGKSLAYLVKNLHVLVCNITTDCPENCFCEDRPAEKHIWIDCSNTSKLTMPRNLPSVSKCSQNSRSKLQIDLSFNRISDNLWTTYTQDIIFLNISNNTLKNIDSNFFKDASSNLKLDIRYNMMTSLPSTIQNIHYNNLYFDNNPLQCNCEFLWFNDWIRVHSKHINHTCYVQNEKHLIKEVTDDYLECSTDLAILLCSILIVFVLVVLSVFVYQKWTYETKVILYHVLGKFSKKNKKSDKEAYQFDVYLSSNVENEDVRLWVKDNLLVKLDTCGLDVYHPPRNDPANDSKIDVLIENITKSRKILIVLDKSYLNYGWCIEEFDQAHQNMCEDNDRKIIVVLYSDNINLDDIQQESLKSYIKHKQCINRGDFLFWPKLKYEIFNMEKEVNQAK